MSESKRKRAEHEGVEAEPESMQGPEPGNQPDPVAAAPAAPARPGMLLVAAPPGLSCPMELSRKRILDKPQWVRSTAYYRRRIAEGSLVHQKG